MRIARVIFGVGFVVAGVLHFVKTPMYVSIMPPYLPHPAGLVLASGAAEIAGGLGILVERTRRAAAWGLVALLVAVFPANVTMIQEHGRFPGIPLWVLWLRLPLQIPLIWLALRYTRKMEG